MYELSDNNNTLINSLIHKQDIFKLVFN